MPIKQAKGIPTIDVALVTIKEASGSGDEYILDTSSKIGVNPVIDSQDAIKLVIKGRLKAQKPPVKTITGNTIVLTDNVFTPELVEFIQGGTIEKDVSGSVTGYTPPVVGSDVKGKIFILCAYSAVYSPAGTIINYERIEYPNCQGEPIALSAEDGVFRTSEYTINSAPDVGEAPYKITYVDELPVVTPEE